MIDFKDVVFKYHEGGFTLKIPELNIPAGQTVAFVGPSGSGKTTMMYLASGILPVHSGEIRVEDTYLNKLNDKQRRAFRNARYGFVFQDFELLEYLTVHENIILPFLINKSLKLTADVRDSVKALAETVGLGKKLSRYPHLLSHGERQRVAICRALITNPDIVIADEPTSSLDFVTTETIMEILFAQVTQRKATFLMLTHNRSLLDEFDRVVDVDTFAVRDAK